MKPISNLVEAGMTEIDNQIASGRQELQNAEAQIDSARNQIQVKKQVYNKQKITLIHKLQMLEKN